jgi:hypothetical protein
MKHFWLAIILLFASSFFAQERPNVVLIDEFGRQHCDEFLARIDNLFLQMNSDPTSRGYFVITGEHKFLSQKLGMELMFESAVVGRAFDRNRVTIVRGEETGDLQVRLWLVPEGNAASPFETVNWKMKMGRADEPFLLRSDMEQICSPPPFLTIAKDLFAANPEGLVYVVVHGQSPKERQRELSRSRRALSGVDPARIRYLLRYSNGGRYSDYYFAVGKRKRIEFKSYF